MKFTLIKWEAEGIGGGGRDDGFQFNNLKSSRETWLKGQRITLLFSFFPSLQSCLLVLSLSHDCCDKTSSPHERRGNISACTHSPSGHTAPTAAWPSFLLGGLWVMESIKGELDHSRSLERPGDVVTSWRRSLPSAGCWLTLSFRTKTLSFRLNYLTSVDPPTLIQKIQTIPSLVCSVPSVIPGNVNYRR